MIKLIGAEKYVQQKFMTIKLLYLNLAILFMSFYQTFYLFEQMILLEKLKSFN